MKAFGCECRDKPLIPDHPMRSACQWKPMRRAVPQPFTASSARIARSGIDLAGGVHLADRLI